MRRTTIFAMFVLDLAACSVRTQHHSEAGREFAQRLCAIQNNCNCVEDFQITEDIIIPDCETRVEREFAESEQRALDAGLVYDPECMEVFLEKIDALGDCGLNGLHYGPCVVYGGNREEGEPCEVFDVYPLMSSCRAGLGCADGICKDSALPILPLGAICSTEQADLPTGSLGRCDEGLLCDSLYTRRCEPTMYDPAPPGGECTFPYECLDDYFCRPQGEDLEPSEERPGVCVERTPLDEPCTLAYECEWYCNVGRCWQPQPALCYMLDSWSASREWY